MSPEGKPNLAVSIGRLKLANPVMTASGTYGYGQEYAPYLEAGRLGAVVSKGLTLEPRLGNPPPRLVETPCGLLNSIGMENVGLAAFLEGKLPYLAGLGTRVVVNIMGGTPDEYARLAEALGAASGVDALELNVSCPNVAEGGICFGLAPDSVAGLLRRVKGACGLPLIVKLSPEAPDIVAVARAAADSGADGVSLINTIRALAVDVNTRRPRLAVGTGGLSGPAIRPLALRLVYEVARAVDIPVIGIGGIATATDALEFLIAGALAVQVGTAIFSNPRAPLEVLEGIEAYLVRQGIGDVNELVGSLRMES